MPEARVLVLSDYAGGDGAATGGAGHVVADSHRALVERGVAAELVAGFGPGSTLGGHDLRDEGAGGARRVIWNGAARAALAPVLARHDPASTLVILHQWTRYLSPAAIGLLGDYPVMIYGHDHFWACPNGAYFHFPRQEVCDRQPLGPRCLVAGCDRAGWGAKLGRTARQAVLAVARHRGRQRRVMLHLSERGRRLIAPLLPGEHHALIHNPLTVPAALPAASTPRFDIGYVGRLEPEKGVGQLIEAVRANRWSALLVGEGSLVPRAAATPGVTWRGWQPREAMAAAMRQCRVVVLPSLWPETWGLVVAEAMAAGVPVLVSNRAGAAELVERFGGGALFDPGKPGDLARQAATLLAEPPPPLAETWDAFRHHLSPTRHADRLVMLARHLWGMELAPSTSGTSSRVSARPASAQV